MVDLVFIHFYFYFYFYLFSFILFLDSGVRVRVMIGHTITHTSVTSDGLVTVKVTKLQNMIEEYRRFWKKMTSYSVYTICWSYR